MGQENKKECQFCGNNSYLGNYAHHLQNQHKKEWGVRQMVKSLSGEELEKVRKFILEMRKKD